MAHFFSEMVLWTWVLELELKINSPIISSITKLLYLFEPQFAYLYNGIKIYHSIFMIIEFIVTLR